MWACLPHSLHFLKSYLCMQKQYGEYCSNKSFETLATSGVLQGSVLDPLLFIIFINDNVDSIDIPCLLYYVDDLNLYWRTESFDDCEKIENSRTS